MLVLLCIAIHLKISSRFLGLLYCPHCVYSRQASQVFLIGLLALSHIVQFTITSLPGGSPVIHYMGFSSINAEKRSLFFF